MTPWLRNATLLAAVLGGIAAGTAARALRSGPPQVGEGARRGHGERLVEYFDPACEGSRALHRKLDEKFVARPFEHVMIPVAVARGATPVLADGLCALSGDRAWQQASAWAVKPARHPELPGMDPVALEACAATVETATRHLATLSGTGEVLTPMVEFRGRVYVGTASTAALLAALDGVASP